MYRHHPLFEKVAELVAAGVIGDLFSLFSRFSFFLDDRGDIAASAELAGGALMDVGCYCVHVSRMITGIEPLRAQAFERRSTVDDLLVGALEFPGGVLASFETSIATVEIHRVEVVGTKASIILPSPWHPDPEPRATDRPPLGERGRGDRGAGRGLLPPPGRGVRGGLPRRGRAALAGGRRDRQHGRDRRAIRIGAHRARNRGHIVTP